MDHATAKPPTETLVEPRTYCEERERRLRASFEERIAKLEKTRDEQKNEYVEIMKECIIVSDEQLAVAKFKLEESCEAIDDLRKIVKSGEAKIKELTKLVRSLREQLSRSKDIKSKPPAVKAKCDKPASEKISKIKKCEYTPMNIGNICENDSFPRFFTLTLPENEKRKVCPFMFESMICEKLGGPHESIAASGRDGSLVKVATRTQGEMKREDSIIKLQSRKKVGRSEAKRILLGDDPTLGDRQQKPEYARYLSILLSETNRRICPFKAETFF